MAFPKRVWSPAGGTCFCTCSYCGFEVLSIEFCRFAGLMLS